MKTIKYTAVAAVLSFSLAACNGNRNNATLGNTTDTSNVSAGANAGGTSPADHGDTSMNHKDSGNSGNANPTGRMNADTTKKSTKP